MMSRRWAFAGVAAATALMLAGCYGGWIFGIVESFGTQNGPKITTVVGNGTAGFMGDGGPATSAELNQPNGVAFDSLGNMYIADTNNAVIRKVDTNGVITTVAGTPKVPGAATNVVATAATFNNPISIVVDALNSIYLADSANDVIREFTVGGTITTIAGTPGSRGSNNGAAITSTLWLPTGVAVDKNGNVYIADFNNTVVRELSSGNVSTFAGNGTQGYSGDGGAANIAELNYPYGVAVDSAGNVYIADTTNAVIRKVTASTGYISTIAGNGITGYSGDGGPATSASINLPTDLAVDAAGNVYIADRNNGVIRKVDTSGNISTVAGNWRLGNGYAGDGNVATDAMLNLPWGIAFDPQGNLYIADTHNNRIRKVSLGK